MIILRALPDSLRSASKVILLSGGKFLQYMKQCGASALAIISYKKERHSAAEFFWKRWLKARSRNEKGQIQKEVAKKKVDINKKYLNK